MHNKCRRGVNGLHGGGLSADQVSESTRLTQADKAAMAEVLGEDRPQWLGGCQVQRDVIDRRNSADQDAMRDL